MTGLQTFLGTALSVVLGAVVLAYLLWKCWPYLRNESED